MNIVKKIEAAYVAMAVLYLEDDLHSEDISLKVLDSDLSVLGYRGTTPEKTIHSMLQNSPKWSHFFAPGKEPSHFCLGDRDEVLNFDEVLAAIYSIQKMTTLINLALRHALEFTFWGSSLVAVRNFDESSDNENPTILRIDIPKKITKKDINPD